MKFGTIRIHTLARLIRSKINEIKKIVNNNFTFQQLGDRLYFKAT